MFKVCADNMLAKIKSIFTSSPYGLQGFSCNCCTHFHYALMLLHKKKSNGVGSCDLGDYFSDPRRPIHRSG